MYLRNNAENERFVEVSGYSRTDAGELPVTCDRSADLEAWDIQKGSKSCDESDHRNPKEQHCKRGVTKSSGKFTQTAKIGNLLFTDKRMANREPEHSQSAEADIDFVSMVLSFKKCSPQ